MHRLLLTASLLAIGSTHRAQTDRAPERRPAPAGGGSDVELFSDLVPPDLVAFTVASELFGRAPLAGLELFVVEGDPAGAIDAWTGESPDGLAFELAVVRWEAVPKHELRDELLELPLAPELRAGIASDAWEYAEVLGVMATPLGTLAVYGPCVTLADADGSPTRYFSVQSCLSRTSTEQEFLPALRAARAFAPGAGELAELLADGGGAPLAFSFRSIFAAFRKLVCRMKTGACVFSNSQTLPCLTLGLGAQAALCGVVMTNGSSRCCRACRCWKALGRISSCLIC